MNELYQRSIEIILAGQSANGGYIASPNFPTYHYCWFRDGSFIAYAMDLAGEHDSARRFHQWAADRVNERTGLVRTSLEKVRAGLPLTEAEILHTRYRLDGTAGEEGDWPNFQLDGFGTWLWALHEHRLLQQSIPNDWLEAANLVADYLSALWNRPCYDCWEEFPDHVHPHTLAAIYGGLQAHTALTGADHTAITNAIRQMLLDNAEEFGHFVKFKGAQAVDASLLGLAVPYGVIAPDDPRMLKTVECIEATIWRDGGVHRYAADTYYGGGAWILLTAWLGWYYHELAALQPQRKADLDHKLLACLRWLEAHQTKELYLPEQVAENLNDASYYPTWVERWGKSASPLLWSHAKYIILQKHLSADE